MGERRYAHRRLLAASVYNPFLRLSVRASVHPVLLSRPLTTPAVVDYVIVM